MIRRRFLECMGGALAGCWQAAQAAAGLGAVAYTQKDGLWVRELPDGEPVRAAAGARIDSPRFSASGEWVAFYRDGALCVAPASGGAEQRLGRPGAGCRWMPRTDELLVGSRSGLRVFSPGKGWTGEIPHASLGVFSPDGREIVYGEEAPTGRVVANAPIRIGRLCRMAMGQPGAARVLFARESVGASPVCWTGDSVIFRQDPDFSASVAADGLELFRVSDAGGEVRSLGVTAVVASDMISVSAQGLLAVSAGFGREDWERRRIAAIDPATGAVRYLTGERMAAVTPSWSPAGDRIAYAAAPAPAGLGTGPAQAPDGRFRAAARPMGQGTGGGQEAKQALGRRRIWVADAAGSNPPAVRTRNPLYRDEEPMWSADGTKILFCRMDLEGRKSLWLMDADGSGETQVAELYTDPGQFGIEGTWFGYYGHINWRRMVDWAR